jgi:hypothetical protein
MQLGRLRGDKGFTPEVEEKIKKILKDERKKLPFNKQLQIGNSEYGDTNSVEWFAEQFAVYSMGKLDKVHPAFIKLNKGVRR